MAASSPANSELVVAASSPGGSLLSTASRGIKTARGLNKPKCIQCGNVARSRCPYQSCKNCCSKAQNPCHIHVLKQHPTLPDKGPAASSPKVDQRTTEVSPSSTTHRVPSYRQLSQSFSQFNNLHIPIRSKKPLTRKEAAAVNEWRFSKLKEFKDCNIEAENVAFDRYMQNISLLEEVLSTESAQDDSMETEVPAEDNPGTLALLQKLRHKLNPARADYFRERVQHIVNQRLRELQELEQNDVAYVLNDQNEYVRKEKRAKSLRDERASAISDLNDKLNKAQNVDDLKTCLVMKSQIFKGNSGTSQTTTNDVEVSKDQIAEKDSMIAKESGISPPKLLRRSEIDQEYLHRIDTHFSSLEQVEKL